MVLSSLLIVSSVLLNACAQLMLKAGITASQHLDVQPSTWPSKILSIGLQPFILGGLACYVVSVVIWIMALARVPVSVAYPMLSIGYVFNAVAAWYLFGEPLSLMKFAGIFVILVGVFMIARSA